MVDYEYKDLASLLPLVVVLQMQYEKNVQVASTVLPHLLSETSEYSLSSLSKVFANDFAIARFQCNMACATACHWASLPPPLHTGRV